MEIINRMRPYNIHHAKLQGKVQRNPSLSAGMTGETGVAKWRNSWHQNFKNVELLA
jgi:hypothetical protein